ncbi:MAG: DedA family protein [Ignavibacteria bacterium]|nr:DedA family protein [Ignavibacteria bacterium]
MNDFIHHLASLDPIWVYAIIFFVAFVENIFPPSPSDAIVVFGGALAAMDRGNFVVALIAGTAGSTLGFMTMFSIGKWFGRKILEAGRIKFIRPEGLHKMEHWFLRYGYWLIVANRFLAGTRAVVSFFAGISELDFVKTSILSCVSSLFWYGILVYTGYSLGEHWEAVASYLKSYSEVMTGIILLAGLILLVRYYLRKNPGGEQRD